VVRVRRRECDTCRVLFDPVGETLWHGVAEGVADGVEEVEHIKGLGQIIDAEL